MFPFDYRAHVIRIQFFGEWLWNDYWFIDFESDNYRESLDIAKNGTAIKPQAWDILASLNDRSAVNLSIQLSLRCNK